MGTIEAYGSNIINSKGEGYTEITWNDWNALTPAEQAAIPRAVITNVPGASGSIPVELIKTLWTNPTPTAAFPAQDITLASDDYDIAIWIYRVSTNDANHIWTAVEKGKSVVMNAVAPSSSYISCELSRAAIYNNDTSYGIRICALGTIKDSSQSYNTSASHIIPVAVYGIKKSISLDITALVASVSTNASKCMMSDGVTSVENKLTANNYDNAGTFQLPTDGSIVTFNSDGYVVLNAPYGSDNLIYVKLYGRTGAGSIDVHCQGTSNYTDSNSVFVRKGMRASIPTVTGTAKAAFVPLIV